MEDCQIDTEAMRRLLAHQLPQTGICVFPLDGSCWPRPRGRVLEDLQYVYQASSDVNGGTVTVGYPYSLLEWCAEAHSSWSLPLDVRRIPSQKTAQEVGAEQVQALAALRVRCNEALDIVAADGKYGNAGFLEPLRGLRLGIVVRLRRNRVLYRPALPVSTPRRGRPRKHGSRFACKDPTTWGPPDEVMEFEDERYGRVRLERWNSLHERKAPALVYDLVCASIHLERENSPKPSGLPGYLLRPSRRASSSRRKPSGAPMCNAGRSSQACASAKRSWAGRCPVFSVLKPAISGRTWWRWHTGCSTWPARLSRTRLCLGKSCKRA